MALVTITSDSGRPMSGFETKKGIRDASFSSYLDTAEESFVLQLAKTSKNLHTFSSSLPQDHFPLGLSRKKPEFGEIDVFSAEKYFKEEEVDEAVPKLPQLVRDSNPTFHTKKDDTLHAGSLKQKIHPRTPSVRSESSWNSRSALLQIPSSNQQQQPPLGKAHNTRARSFLTSLGCNCSCNDHDAVTIDNEIRAKKASSRYGKWSLFNKSRPNTRINESGHIKIIQDEISFPAFNNATGNNAKLLHSQQEEEEKIRKSLEVFGSPVLSRAAKASSPETEIKLLAWDAIPPRQVEIELPASPDAKYNDTGSDASSDLFEIESLSTNANPYLARQTSDGMSGCLTPTAYAPSEASIEWSTVTASAADFSVMSDSEELNTTSTGRKTRNEKMPRRRSSILSGCKSQKAVRVAGEDSQRRARPESFTRFHPENKQAGFDARKGDLRFEMLSLSESQLKHAPHVLHMH